ncbi:helix-turn-helix transcriptional regulator, partial [Streptomyces albiflaviniger]|nr:helix-turn-helix transcriptional regulator [Streptomyces albiflaviniger]
MSTQAPAPSRREQILKEAARLFAERGFHGVGVDEIGAAVGISGPG